MDADFARMLSDAAGRWAAEHYTLAQRKPLLELPGAFSRRVWSEQAELGWLALRLPEADGGLDADPLAIGALMEVVGNRLLLEPLLASAIVATSLVARLASPARRAALTPQLAGGELGLAFAGALGPSSWRSGALHGQAAAVLHGDQADALLVATQEGPGGPTLLLWVDTRAAGVQRRPYRLVDGRGAADLVFDAAPGEVLAAGPQVDAAIELAHDEAHAALCAEALGSVRALLAATGEYLKQRQQFGRPIGSHQVLQHRAVEMFVLQEEVAALAARALQALALPAHERGLAVSAARAYIIRAARQVANDALQLHGGVGITEEFVVSHHFRRLMVNAALFGGRDAQFARFVPLAQESMA